MTLFFLRYVCLTAHRLGMPKTLLREDPPLLPPLPHRRQTPLRLLYADTPERQDFGQGISPER